MTAAAAADEAAAVPHVQRAGVLLLQGRGGSDRTLCGSSPAPHGLCWCGCGWPTHTCVCLRACCVALSLLQLVPLESSKLKGLVNTRVGVMQEIGWDPEWEVRGSRVCVF